MKRRRRLQANSFCCTALDMDRYLCAWPCRAADAREGELIRQKAAAEAAELAAKEAARKEEQTRMNSETKAANAALQVAN